MGVPTIAAANDSGSGEECSISLEGSDKSWCEAEDDGNWGWNEYDENEVYETCHLFIEKGLYDSKCQEDEDALMSALRTFFNQKYVSERPLEQATLMRSLQHNEDHLFDIFYACLPKATNEEMPSPILDNAMEIDKEEGDCMQV